MAGTVSLRTGQEVDRLIGRRVRQFRERAQLSQALVAARLGISIRELEAIEVGTLRANPARLTALAMTFGANVSAFFDDAPSSPPAKPLWLTPRRTF